MLISRVYEKVKGLKSDPKARTLWTLHISRAEIITHMAGFFLSMAMPVSGMAPFGMAFLAQERRLSLRTVTIFMVVSLGSLVSGGRLGAAKYICAGLMYLAVLFVLKKGVRMTDVTAGLTAGVSVLVSGMVVILLQGISVSEVLILLCEAAVVVSGALMIEKGDAAIREGKVLSGKLDADTKLSLGALAAVALLSFKNIYLGSALSIMNCIAAVSLLVVAYSCGASYSTGMGVVLGLICGIGSDFFMPILGAFSLCGFVAGTFSKFGKAGAATGLILANGILVIYTNSAVESVMSLVEIILSSVIFAFLPNQLNLWVKDVVLLGEENKESILRIKDGVRLKLMSAAAAFENMAKSLDKLSEDNKNDSDIATVFDAAADKVCKKCKKAQLCWGKDFNTTYSDMLGLMGIMREKGKVNPEDANDRFKNTCIKIASLMDELNHRYDLYRLNCVWKSKTAERQSVIGRQIAEVSGIMSEMAKEIQSTAEAAVSARKVKSRLEDKGIKPKSVEVTREKDGRHLVEILVKKSDYGEKNQLVAERVMKNLLCCKNLKTDCWNEGNKYRRVIFCEGEKYKIEAQSATRAAADKNGDSFRMVHLKGGKYVIAVSDGMGIGSRASKESEAILELLDSFLQAGFECRAAIRLINSIMILKSEESRFVTMDLCIIDLYTGEAKFIKMGAAPSFVVQKNGVVDTVRAASLPTGLFSEAEADVVSRYFNAGDQIVMVTDGIETKETGNRWLDEYLKNTAVDKTPGELSRGILNRAIEENQGTVSDDMTVLSIKIKAAS